MASVVFRRAQPQDYPAILRLQSENFIANLSEKERKEGFLSAEFSREQVAKHGVPFMQVSLAVTLRLSIPPGRHQSLGSPSHELRDWAAWQWVGAAFSGPGTGNDRRRYSRHHCRCRGGKSTALVGGRT